MEEDYTIIIDAKAELDKAQKQIKDLNNMVDQLNSKIKYQTTTINDMMGEIAKANKLIKDMDNKIGQLNGQKISLSSELKKAEQDNLNLQKTIETNEANSADIKKKIQELIEENKDLKFKNKEDSAYIEEITKEFNALIGEKKTLQTTIDGLKKNTTRDFSYYSTPIHKPYKLYDGWSKRW